MVHHHSQTVRPDTYTCLTYQVKPPNFCQVHCYDGLPWLSRDSPPKQRSKLDSIAPDDIITQPCNIALDAKLFIPQASEGNCYMSQPLTAPSPSRLNLNQHAPLQHPNNMPPKKTTASPRHKPRENMFFEPGVRGRQVQRS